jgi:hypothetical protein
VIVRCLLLILLFIERKNISGMKFLVLVVVLSIRGVHDDSDEYVVGWVLGMGLARDQKVTKESTQVRRMSTNDTSVGSDVCLPLGKFGCSLA